MQIGELAKRADVSAKTIRYYEAIGIVSEPERTASAYRNYDESALERLQTELQNLLEKAKTLPDACGDTYCHIIESARR